MDAVVQSLARNALEASLDGDVDCGTSADAVTQSSPREFVANIQAHVSHTLLSRGSVSSRRWSQHPKRL